MEATKRGKRPAKLAWLAGAKTAIRESSRGHTILFHGPPSSSASKRTTAEMLSQEFGKELYAVDLSQVVGKYIGETEKNLALVFKKATEKDLVLFLMRQMHCLVGEPI